MAYSAIIVVQYLYVSYSFNMQYLHHWLSLLYYLITCLRLTEFHVEIISDHLIVE